MSTKAPYGYCPICRCEGQMRERGINGNDRCHAGHTYPSTTALKRNEAPLLQDADRALSTALAATPEAYRRPQSHANPEADKKPSAGAVLQSHGNASAVPAAPAPDADQAEPMFWVRLRSDGGYEGPIHNDAIESVRKASGTWRGLYLEAAPTAGATAPKFNTSKAGRDEVATFFAQNLRRTDFGNYIRNALAADFACALAPTLYAIRSAGATAPTTPTTAPPAFAAMVKAASDLVAAAAPAAPVPEHMPVGPESEAATYAALGMQTLPPIRLPADVAESLAAEATQRGLIVQALVRERLSAAPVQALSDERLFELARAAGVLIVTRQEERAAFRYGRAVLAAVGIKAADKGGA